MIVAKRSMALSARHRAATNGLEIGACSLRPSAARDVGRGKRRRPAPERQDRSADCAGKLRTVPVHLADPRALERITHVRGAFLLRGAGRSHRERAGDRRAVGRALIGFHVRVSDARHREAASLVGTTVFGAAARPDAAERCGGGQEASRRCIEGPATLAPSASFEAVRCVPAEERAPAIQRAAPSRFALGVVVASLPERETARVPWRTDRRRRFTYADAPRCTRDATLGVERAGPELAVGRASVHVDAVRVVAGLARMKRSVPARSSGRHAFSGAGVALGRCRRTRHVRARLIHAADGVRRVRARTSCRREGGVVVIAVAAAATRVRRPVAVTVCTCPCVGPASVPIDMGVRAPAVGRRVGHRAAQESGAGEHRDRHRARHRTTPPTRTASASALTSRARASGPDTENRRSSPTPTSCAGSGDVAGRTKHANGAGRRIPSLLPAGVEKRQGIALSVGAHSAGKSRSSAKTSSGSRSCGSIVSPSRTRRRPSMSTRSPSARPSRTT